MSKRSSTSGQPEDAPSIPFEISDRYSQSSPQHADQQHVPFRLGVVARVQQHAEEDDREDEQTIAM
jgi:hypothetical protein